MAKLARRICLRSIYIRNIVGSNPTSLTYITFNKFNMKKIHQKSTFVHLGNKTKCIINYEVIDSKSKEVLFKGKSAGISVCAPEDTYNKLLGERIAESKATIKMTDAIIIWANKIVENNNREFVEFSELVDKSYFMEYSEKERLADITLYNL